MRRIAHDHAGGQQAQLDSARGMAGVGAAVDLEDDRDGRFRAAEFFGHLGNQAALAFVAEGNADIGDELAGERGERHKVAIKEATKSKTLLPGS